MRAIKFRAWDAENEVMINENFYEFIMFDGTPIEVSASYGDVYRSPLNYVLMQFTGLSDSNGDGIYEGDIVKYTSRYRGDVMDCVVVFDSKQGQYKFCPFSMYKANAGDGGWTGFEYTTAKRTEIIGNIYDNKSLLDNEEETK